MTRSTPTKPTLESLVLSPDPRVRMAAIDHYRREAERMRREAYAQLFRQIGAGLRRAFHGAAQLLKPGLRPSAR